MSPAAYIAEDRRRALASGRSLPLSANGSVLFADISGFTPLSEELVQTHGIRRGAENLTIILNQLYAHLIADAEAFGGSVVGFSGDALTCWFAAEAPCASNSLGNAPQRAVGAAAAMQETMRKLAGVHALAIKVAIASGLVHRWVVGDPEIQLLDLLGGAVMDRVAVGEQLAGRGEILADLETLRALGNVDDITPALWREQLGARFALIPEAVRKQQAPPERLPLPDVDATAWIHPYLAPLLSGGQARFLAELRPATALFVRFAGIHFDADNSALALLNEYICWAQQVVQRYEGLLVQLTTGDKGSYFYAAFGAPHAHDDDAVRAAATALDLRSPPPKLLRFASIRAGISSGIMRIGAYGGPTRCTYGVLGDEVNVAACLMSIAAPNQILVAPTVFDALRHAMELEPLGLHVIKGKADPVELFALQGRRAQSGTRMMHLYADPLVGRDDELAPLAAALNGLARADGRQPGKVIVIEGPAGIGKSHLAATVAQQATSAGMRAIHAACQSTTQAIPYFAARQTLRGLLELPSHADAIHVVQAIGALVPGAGARAPLLADLLDVDIADSAVTTGLDAKVRQGARSALFLELVAAAALQHPLLLILEDAHWIDEASRGLFAMLLPAIPAYRAALLLVQRPPDSGESALLGHEIPAAALRIGLGELSLTASTALIAQRLGAPVDSLAADVIHAQAQGNPFFLEELTSALRDAGRLVRHSATWRLSEPTILALRAAQCLADEPDAPRLAEGASLDTVDLGVPTSVQGVVLARLDRLPEHARLTLKIASVIGRTFALDVLQAIRPLHDLQNELLGAIEQALARDLVRAEGINPAGPGEQRPVYIFKHNIIRDVAYNTLLAEQQRDLHLGVAEALESLHSGSVEVLAHHYHNSDTERPDVRARAVRYLELAAVRARRDYANDTALLYYGRATELEPRAAFLSGQAEALHILGRREEEHALLLRLERAPDATSAERARLWGDYWESIGDYAHAVDALSAGLRASAEDPLVQAQCRNRLGMVAWRQGEYDEAESHFAAVRAICGAAAGDDPLAAETAAANYGMGLVFRQFGRTDDARAAFEADLLWQRVHGSREREARARTALGHVESIAGRHEAALAAYLDALAIRKAIGDKAGIGASLLAVAQAYGSLGDHAKAVPRLDEALRVQQAIGNRFEEWLVWNELGILHWLVGRYVESERCYLAGLEVSRAIGSEFGEAYLLCNLGQLQRDAGSITEALCSLRSALALAQAQGDAGLEATCRVDLALTLVIAGDPVGALDEASHAERIFDELGQVAALTAVFAASAQAHLAAGDRTAAAAAAHKGLANLEKFGGDYFPHRDGFWCACVLSACGESDQAAQAFRAAASTLIERAERISEPEMRSSFLNNIVVNRAIQDVADGLSAQVPPN